MIPLKCPFCAGNRVDTDGAVALTMDPDQEDVMLDIIKCDDCRGHFYVEQ